MPNALISTLCKLERFFFTEIVLLVLEMFMTAAFGFAFFGQWQRSLTKKYPLNWLYITAVNMFIKQYKPKNKKHTIN